MSQMFNPSDHANMDGAIELPPGYYIVKCEGFTRKLSESSGNDYLLFKLRVQHGEFQDALIFEVVSLSEKALWRLGNMCVAAGVQESFDIESDKELERVLNNRIMKVRTKWEEYEGERRTRVQSFCTMNSEELEQFASAPPQQGEAPGAPPPDDDYAF